CAFIDALLTGASLGEMMQLHFHRKRQCDNCHYLNSEEVFTSNYVELRLGDDTNFPELLSRWDVVESMECSGCGRPNTVREREELIDTGVNQVFMHVNRHIE